MVTTGQPDPQRACDTAEFLAALRQLKERSGLTYRQLEVRAAQHGEVLPRSTLADVLRGRTLPRPDLLAAFVRACGDGDRMALWLQARENLTRPAAAEAVEEVGEAEEAEEVEEVEAAEAGEALEAADAADVAEESKAVEAADAASGNPPPRLHRAGRVHGVPVLLVAAVAVSVLAATAWALVSSGGDDGTTGSRGAGLAAADTRSGLPRGHAQIRPVLANGLCLTDGHGSRYRSLVAVQRPCDEVAPQETALVPLGGNTFRIQWYHPEHGTGCLTVPTAGPAVGLLEPWDDCERTTRFRIVPTGPDGSRRYSIRVDGRGCVGIRDAVTSEGAEAVLEPCRPKDSQVFVIQPAP